MDPILSLYPNLSRMSIYLRNLVFRLQTRLRFSLFLTQIVHHIEKLVLFFP